MITEDAATALRDETAARVAAQVEAARRRADARQALDREKRSRRRAGVDLRNHRKITRLENSLP